MDGAHSRDHSKSFGDSLNSRRRPAAGADCTASSPGHSVHVLTDPSFNCRRHQLTASNNRSLARQWDQGTANLNTFQRRVQCCYSAQFAANKHGPCSHIPSWTLPAPPPPPPPPPPSPTAAPSSDTHGPWIRNAPPPTKASTYLTKQQVRGSRPTSQPDVGLTLS